MKTHVFQTEMMAPLPIKDAFSVFENPYNLARITPPWLNFKILTKDLQMRKGANIDYEFRWLGIPLRWKTVITEYDPPHLFVDEMVKGPYSVWRHRHTFREVAQGTAVADRVEYALPFGIFGSIAHAIKVREQVKEIFAFRQQALAQLFEETRATSKSR